MVNLSEESDEDEVMKNQSEKSNANIASSWQSVTTKKRKRIESPKKTKRIDSRDIPTISSNNNRYAELDIEEDNEDNNEKTTPKPPPIYIPNVQNINLMITKLSDIISSTEFSYKSLREGQVRLMIKSVDSYRKIIKYLDTCNINFHTYQLKQERAYRVVIKGLHPTTPPEDIKAELLSLGHSVRSVTNVRSRVSKEPLSMFYVDLDPDPKNKSIYETNYINHAVVKIEPPLRTNDLVQCYRCQQFGHTKAYCKKPYRCVKCGLDHPTIECKKAIDTPPRCVHCMLNHTANYKGCRVYQNLVSNRINNQSQHSNTQRNYNVTKNSTDFPQLNNSYNCQANQNRFNVSFSETVRASNVNQDSRLDRLEKMVENLMNMMSMLMTKLCN